MKPGQFFSLAVWAVFFAFVLLACSPTRRLKEGEFLLVKQQVVETDASYKGSDEIESFYTQKLNRKWFGFWRFYLQVYNIPNPKKLAQKKQKQLARLDSINLAIQEANKARIAQGKKPKKLKKEKLLFGEWLQKIGESPTLLDSNRIERTKSQMLQYVKNKGYFYASLSDSVALRPSKKKAEVFYFVNRGPAYFIDSLFFSVKDPTLDWFYEKNKFKNKILPYKQDSAQFDLQLLDQERERIASIYRDQGFYLFDKNKVEFLADTTLGNHKVHIEMNIPNPNYTAVYRGDTLSIDHHNRFRIGRIIVIPEYDPGLSISDYSDSLFYEGIWIKYNGKSKLRPKVLSRALFMRPGDLYQPRAEALTRKALGDLRLFRYINLRFVPRITGNRIDSLDCFVELSPGARQGISADIQGTNTDGNLGVSLGAGYTNRNIFRGAEILEISANGGAEVQVIQGDSADISTDGLPFNTLEIGGQISLSTPKFLAPFKISKWARPRSRVLASINYQRRPDYDRTVSTVLFGYEWTQPPPKRSWIQRRHELFYQVNAAEVSLININKTPEFEAFLQETGDLFVQNSFRQHYIQSSSGTITMTNGSTNPNNKPYYFARLNAQVGGNLLALGHHIFAPKQTNEEGKFEVFGIQFAQFIRTEFDFRYYYPFSKKTVLAFRSIVGLGRAYGNTDVLPFEKSFFAGGANDLRAWLPRSLGPGSYQQEGTGRVDQVGDIKLLGQAEFRFPMYGFLEGAFFADFGNIWLSRSDNDRPNGQFAWNRFMDEFALGTGLGLRLNLGFFIFRLDFAIPLRDPTMDPGKRWVIERFKLSNDLRVNIGIGYPF